MKYVFHLLFNKILVNILSFPVFILLNIYGFFSSIFIDNNNNNNNNDNKSRNRHIVRETLNIHFIFCIEHIFK